MSIIDAFAAAKEQWGERLKLAVMKQSASGTILTCLLVPLGAGMRARAELDPKYRRKTRARSGGPAPGGAPKKQDAACTTDLVRVVVLPVPQRDTAVAIDGMRDVGHHCTHVASAGLDVTEADVTRPDANDAAKAPCVENTAVTSAGVTMQVLREYGGMPSRYCGYSHSRTLIGIRCLLDGVVCCIVVQGDLARAFSDPLDINDTVAISLAVDLRAECIAAVARLADLTSRGVSAFDGPGPIAFGPGAPEQSIVSTPALADARLQCAGVAFEHRHRYSLFLRILG